MLDERNAAIMDAVNRTGEVFLSHTRLADRFTIRLSVGNLRTEERHVERAWELLRREATGLMARPTADPRRIGRSGRCPAGPPAGTFVDDGRHPARMVPTAAWIGDASIGWPTPAEARLADALARLDGLDLGDAFEPAAPAALVASGLHLAPVPVEAGGLGIGPRAAVELLAALGAIDGSTALGFAMHVHVVGAMADSTGWPEGLRDGSTPRSATRGAAERAGDRGRRRQSGPWRDPGNDRGGATRRRAVPAHRREVVDDLAARAPARARRRSVPGSPRRSDGDASPRSPCSSSISTRPASPGCPGSRRSGCADRRRARLRLDGVLVPGDRMRRPASQPIEPDPRGPGRRRLVRPRHRRRSTSGSGRAPAGTSSAGRSTGGPATDRPRSPTCRRSRSGSAGSTPRCGRRGSSCATWPGAGSRPTPARARRAASPTSRSPS